MDATFEAVRHFVAEQSGNRVERLARETRLLHDLGIDGDDAFELFLAFGERFHVDLSPMEWPAYFGHEGDALGRAIKRLVGGPRAVDDKLPVALEDLAAAAEAGCWPSELKT